MSLRYFTLIFFIHHPVSYHLTREIMQPLFTSSKNGVNLASLDRGIKERSFNNLRLRDRNVNISYDVEAGRPKLPSIRLYLVTCFGYHHM